MAEHEDQPHLRIGQRALANEITKIVHGEPAADSAIEASQVLFDSTMDISAVSESALDFVSREVPYSEIALADVSLVDLLVETGLCQSRKEAKRAVTELSLIHI